MPVWRRLPFGLWLFSAAASASCFWLTQLRLVWESWRDQSGWEEEEQLWTPQASPGLNVGLRTGGQG